MNALNDLRKEIESYCKKYKRDPHTVNLVVATKYFDVQQIHHLYNLGLRDFGENRVQEALVKIEALPKDIRWHFFGHVQRNKVNKIKDRFELIHSIDSFELARKLSEVSTKTQPILLQIKTSDEESKTGFSISAFKEALPRINSLEKIEVRGLMTLAKEGSYQESLKAFKQLAHLKDLFGSKNWQLSMGMSQDFEAAIEAGSTLLRVGRRLL